MSNDYSWTPSYPGRAASNPPAGPSRAQPEDQGYGQPVVPPYGQPAAPPYGQPAVPPYGQPAVPPLDQPAGLPLGQPYPGPVGQPWAQPVYGDPYAQPSSNDPYSQPSRTDSPYSVPPAQTPYNNPYTQPPYNDPYAQPSSTVAPALAPYSDPYAAPTPPGRADVYGDVFSQAPRAGRGMSDTNEMPRVEVTSSWIAMDTVVMQPLDMTMTLATGQIPVQSASSHRRPSRNVTEHVAQQSGLPAGWFRRVAQSAAGVVVVVAVAIAVGQLPSSSPQPAPQQVSSHIDLTCPGLADMQGSLVGVASGGATWQQTGGTPVDLEGSVFTQSTAGPSELSGNGSLAALAQYDKTGMSAAVGCDQPLATGFIQVTSSNATLQLTNTDESDAVLSVFLTGPDGDISAPQLVDLGVGAGSTVSLTLSDYAPGVAPLGITWQSTIGRVVAWALTNTATSFDLASPTKADDDIVLPAVPPSDHISLLLTNPASVRATAEVQMMTADGSFGVVGGEQVSVESRTTMSLDLSGALQGQTLALRVHADMPLAATVVVATATDTASAPGVPASEMLRPNLLGVVNGPAQLVLANNANRQAQVVVTMTSSDGQDNPQTVTLAAGTSAVLDVPDGPQSIKVQGKYAVVGGILLEQKDAKGASGAVSLVPLTPDPAWRGTTPIWVEAQPH